MNKLNLGRRHHPDANDHLHLLGSMLPSGVVLPTSKLWTVTGAHLNQEDTGTCVGHGWCNFLRCAPIRTNAGEHKAFDIYRAAVMLDPWKENDAEAKLPDFDAGMNSGTTVRAGAQAVSAMHSLDSYLWAFKLQPATQWLLSKGPVVVGLNWYDSMYTPDAHGKIAISPNAQLEGGHCFLVRGADTNKKVVHCTNSWGNDWGLHGDFLLSFDDFERLILEDGEVCTAIQK